MYNAVYVDKIIPQLSFLLFFVSNGMCIHDLNPFQITTDIPFINLSPQLSSDIIFFPSRFLEFRREQQNPELKIETY